MKSRTTYAIKNIYASVLTQVINIVVKFVMRTVFTYCLGKEYLGVNGVFSNVLSILSLAELGIGSVIIYSMYKPIAENDEIKIAQYVQYYKKIYTIIGIIIFFMGCCLIPFLDYIISDVELGDLTIIYILFLIQTTLSYCFAQYHSLINAHQMSYEYKKIDVAIALLKVAVQCLLLILAKQYILYLLIDIIFVFARNYIIYVKARRLFPYINNRQKALDRKSISDLWKNAMSNFSIKIGITVINSTDNIILSTFVSTIFVGMYSNYAMVIQIILTSCVLIQHSIIPSIGNACVSVDNITKRNIYDKLFFGYGALFCVIVSCLYGVLQPFVQLWLGDEYLLDNEVVIILTLNCYLSGMHQVNEAFIFADGLYKFFKFKPWIEVIINIIISIIGAKTIGAIGVFVGTAVSHLLVTYWYDAFIVYKHSLSHKVSDYFYKYFKWSLITLTVIFLERLVFTINIFEKLSMFCVVLKGFVACLLSIFVILVFFYSTEEFKYFCGLVHKILKRGE